MVNATMSGVCKLLKWWKMVVLGCSVLLSVERRTCHQEAVGSSLGQAHGVKTLGKFLTPMCLCHQAV